MARPNLVKESLGEYDNATKKQLKYEILLYNYI